MTECTQTSFCFATEFHREVVARFDGGTITAEAGGSGAAPHRTEDRHHAEPRASSSALQILAETTAPTRPLGRAEFQRTRRRVPPMWPEGSDLVGLED